MIPPCGTTRVSAATRRRRETTNDSSETDNERRVDSSLGVRSNVVRLVRKDLGNVGLSSHDGEEST